MAHARSWATVLAAGLWLAAGAAAADDRADDAPSPERDEPGMVDLHVAADDPTVELHELVADGILFGPWGSGAFGVTRAVCRQPCDRRVDGRARRFLLAGEDLSPSEPFSFEGRSGAVVARVGGSRAVSAGGIALTSLALAAIAGAAAMLAYGVAIDGKPVGEGMVADATGLEIGGGALLVSGVGALAGGVAMIVLGRTRVELVEPEPPPRRVALRTKRKRGR